MVKVVLIDPKGVWEGLNNGLASIAANIRDKCTVRVIDFVNYSKGTLDERLAITKDADIVGISMKSFTLLESIMVANKVRELNPNAKIVAGGPHVIVDGYNLLKENSVFDYGVVGEAEFVFQNLVEGKDPKEIQGLIYRSGDDIIQNPMQDWIRDLDNLPFPNYDDFDSVNHDGKIQPIDVWPLVTSRGCPYTCTYCNVPVVIGRKFRVRSKENILKELRWSQEHYKSKEFKVLDDNFTLLMDRAKDICKYFIDQQMGMKWTCPNGIRADRLDEELCKLMKEAGCYSMSIGVESGDPDVFDKINKGEKLADVEKGIKLAQAAGIQIHGFFIIGLVGSSYEADKRSVEFAKRLGISASWGILVPYPGTPVWEQVKADPSTRMLRDWKEGFHIGARPKPVFDTPQYTAEERVKMYYLANMSTIKKRDIPRAAKMIVKGLIAGK
ncbi:MAG: radical SAM protein [Candidatus Aenigmarchaeota archaeon]|nr:radical SAM protein [Candidatus Aenigmarchaeota archaeon]